MQYDFNSPWRGLNSRDEAGRLWTVAGERVTFAGDCRLQVVGRCNERLLSRDHPVLLPPYEAVWQPNGLKGPSILLELQ